MYLATKCFCENEIGSPDKNRIVCETEGKFQKFISCKPDEWCIGPTDETNATFLLESLCTEGTKNRLQQCVDIFNRIFFSIHW